MPLWSIAFAFLLVMSLVTALLFRFDKRRARAGGWRVSEARLLTFALLGGGMGAYWAMRHFRHKTQHWRFRLLVPLFTLAQLALVGWLLWREVAAA
ncbi:MAG: DUF1294 domain-containing protein [Planctomycetota bacterium]|nr:DUF1294 domain-containing protein [Planctomycetota bacterium]